MITNFKIHKNLIITHKNNYVDNDATVESLVSQSLILAASGADIIAPFINSSPSSPQLKSFYKQEARKSSVYVLDDEDVSAKL